MSEVFVCLCACRIKREVPMKIFWFVKGATSMCRLYESKDMTLAYIILRQQIIKITKTVTASLEVKVTHPDS